MFKKIKIGIISSQDSNYWNKVQRLCKSREPGVRAEAYAVASALNRKAKNTFMVL